MNTLSRRNSFFFNSMLILAIGFSGCAGNQTSGAENGTVVSLESKALRLEVSLTPYSYRILEKATGEVLLQHSGTFITTGFPAAIASAAMKSRTETSMEIDASLPGVPDAVTITFAFTFPDVLEVTIACRNQSVKIKEAFRDQGEHYYGIWEAAKGTGLALDNRGAQANLLGTGSPGVNFSSARAPFYVTSGKYGIYAETMAYGEYSIAVANVTSFQFDASALKYHFIYGREYENIFQRYNSIGGAPVMPPDWAFDTIWWSNDHHALYPGTRNAREAVLDTADKLARYRIPASVIWIDRPYGTGANGWGNMDFDGSFPDPKSMVRELNDKGYQLLVWIANRCGEDTLLGNEGAARDFLFSGYTGWPAADMRIPQARDWFKAKLDVFVGMNIRGYKIDRGEESEHPDSVQSENTFLFGKMAAEGQMAGNKNDFLIFARCAYDKERQYAGIWNGDSFTSFTGLSASLINGLKCGAINFPFFGSDIGGYTGRPSGELFIRWFQFGTYCPMMETLITAGRCPWYDYDQETLDAAKKQSEEHHDLIPYTRSYLYQSRVTGMPVMRQMIFAFPEDRKLHDLWDEYMYGAELLVAPVMENGARSRTVYFPEGRWLDYNDKKTVYAGPCMAMVPAPLATIPVFVRENAIVPRGDIVKGNNTWTPDWSPRLRIEIFPTASKTTGFDYYTGTSVQTIRSKLESGILTIACGDPGHAGTLEIYCNGFAEVIKNGVSLEPGKDFYYNWEKKKLTVPFSNAFTVQIKGTIGIF